MAGEKNFNIKNGLSVGGVEVITSAGAFNRYCNCRIN